jgi:HK97 family phage prohead protease
MSAEFVRKSYAVKASVDMLKREVTAYASTFNDVDNEGDAVAPGAFTKTLQERLPKGLIKVCADHGVAMGKLVHAEQDSTGLLTVARYSKTEDGENALVLVADEVCQHYSFSGDILSAVKAIGPDGGKVRLLKEIRLNEVGPALSFWPVNENARILSVKSRMRRLTDDGFARKSLGDLAYVMRETQCLRDALAFGPPLSEDERAIAEELVRLMSASSVTLADLLEAAKPSTTPGESADTPIVEVVPAMADPAITNAAAESLGLAQLLEVLRSRNSNLSSYARS